MTLAISHREGERLVLDCVARAQGAVLAGQRCRANSLRTLKSYRVSTVIGDRYAGEWPRERFQVHGIRIRSRPK